MAVINFSDRVKDTTTSTGTGNLTLSGTAPTGYQSFNDAFGTSANFFYTIEGGSEWEVGQGHLSAATTLVRDTIFESSNSDNAVNFSAGTKNVFCTIPSRHMQRTVTIVKASTTSRAATTVVAADPDLQIPMVSGRTYIIEMVAHLFADNATPDFKYSITQPGTATARYFWRDTNIAGTNTQTVYLSNSPPANQSVLINGATSLLRIQGTYIPNATATWSLDWAQNTSDAGSTHVLAGSHIRYTEWF